MIFNPIKREIKVTMFISKFGIKVTLGTMPIFFLLENRIFIEIMYFRS